MHWTFANFVSVLRLIVGLGIVVIGDPARAEQLVIPVSIGVPSSAVVMPWGAAYAWIDGSQQTINFTNPATSGQFLAPMWASTRSTDPVATGYGVRGGMGVVLPDGTVQLTSSYVSAGALQGSTIDSRSDLKLGDPNAGCGVACLDGLLPGTAYEAWQTELKAAREMNFGPLVVSPVATLFAKTATSQLPAFASSVGTGWTDLGGTVGLDTTYDIANRMLFGLRGSIGTAYRATSFSSIQDGGAVVTNSSGSPFLATAEASFIWKPRSWQTIKAYAGVQVDSRTPLAPDQLGDLGAIGGPITYQSVENYYWGASLKMELEGLTGER